jgi:DNA repair protein RecO (recombination protein O)
MKINDIGIILSASEFQERLLLVKIFSKNHGLVSSVARKPSVKNKSSYQAGNIVNFQKFSRFSGQLGKIVCELDESYQGDIISRKLNLVSYNSISEIILNSFEEGDLHEKSYDRFYEYLKYINDREFFWKRYFLAELTILTEAGYGLELQTCAVTGYSTDLLYVSPKTGRAISKDAACGYEHLLLKLPTFLIQNSEPLSADEVDNALTLINYFFTRYIWVHKKPESPINARNSLKKIASEYFVNSI